MIDVDFARTEQEKYSQYAMKQLLMSLANALTNDLGGGTLHRDNYLRYLQEYGASLGFNMANFN